MAQIATVEMRPLTPVEPPEVFPFGEFAVIAGWLFFGLAIILQCTGSAIGFCGRWCTPRKSVREELAEPDAVESRITEPWAKGATKEKGRARTPSSSLVRELRNCRPSSLTPDQQRSRSRQVSESPLAKSTRARILKAMAESLVDRAPCFDCFDVGREFSERKKNDGGAGLGSGGPMTCVSAFRKKCDRQRRRRASRNDRKQKERII